MLISSTEIARIKSSIEERTPSANTVNDARLHTKSKERVSKWTNTLEARRLQSENERIRRKIAEEALRESIDIQEAQFQFQKRNDEIRRANQLLFQESDRMKLLHSSMMMSDVLADREHQIRIKEELNKLEHIRDIKYEEVAKHNYDRMTTKEEAARLAHVQKKAHIAAEQLAQLNAAKHLRKDEVELKKVEGLLFRQRHSEFLEEEVERKRLEKQSVLNAQKETAKAQEYLNEVKNRMREDVAKEDEKILKHAVRVSEISALRKAKEVEIFQCKQDARQRLIDVQAAQLALNRDTEEERVGQHCRDAEADQNRLLAEKEKCMQQWKKDITESRLAQLEERKIQKNIKLQAEQEAAEKAMELFEDMQMQEEEEKRERRSAEQKVARDLLRQISTRKAITCATKKQQTRTVQRAKQAMHAEAKEFQHFGEQALCEYANAGKNVIPIVQALKTFHKNKNR